MLYMKQIDRYYSERTRKKIFICFYADFAILFDPKIGQKPVIL